MYIKVKTNFLIKLKKSRKLSSDSYFWPQRNEFVDISTDANFDIQ